jgi:hypothetical protein
MKGLAMDRKQKALRNIDRAGRGIEIGPSHNPLAPKRDGYRVEIIDHLTREQLIAKYTGHNVNLDQIEEVDYVWSGQRFAELTGKSRHYDWVVASHVIEHAPDLIGFLNDCDALLKADGVLSLVIPDKRYCFDHYRPISGLARVVDAHVRHAGTHSAGTAAEYFLNVVACNGRIAWDSKTRGTFSFVHTLEQASNAMQDALSEKTYLDLHAWCFTPHSFRLIIHDLYALGLISLREVDYLPTAGCEFFVSLSQSGGGLPLSRLEALERVEAELSNADIKSSATSQYLNVALQSLLRRCKRCFTKSQVI